MADFLRTCINEKSLILKRITASKLIQLSLHICPWWEDIYEFSSIGYEANKQTNKQQTHKIHTYIYIYMKNYLCGIETKKIGKLKKVSSK